MTELDGVDFAVLMAFAGLPLPKRQSGLIQRQFEAKLRTGDAHLVLKELIQPYGRGGDSARFVRRMAGVREGFA